MPKPANEQEKNEHNEGSTPQDLTELLEGLHQYNRHYNVGGILGRKINRMVAKRFGETKQPEETELTVEDLQRQNVEVLDDTGLELQPVSEGILLAEDEEGVPEKQKGSLMRLNLQDGRKFVSYLGKLNPDMMNDNDRESLGEVAKILTVQLKSQYDLEAADDRLLELMGSLDEIIQEYKRLGVEDNIADLEKVLEKAREGVLREYLMAEKLNLHKPFTKEGFVLNWQQDINPEGLEKNWDNVLDTLHQINQNPKAKDIYTQAVATAREAVKNAIAEVSAWKPNYYPQFSNDVYLGILKTVETRLSEF